MLTRLPTLFHRAYVLPDTELEHARGIAERQVRLVKGVFVGAVVLCALAFTPQFSGPGPVLTWAAGQWPDVFGSLVLLFRQAMTFWEVVGSALCVLVLTLACAAELRGLRTFIENLEPIEPYSSIRDAVTRLCATTPAAADYVNSVSLTRNLRLGDWRVAREIVEAGAAG